MAGFIERAPKKISELKRHWVSVSEKFVFAALSKLFSMKLLVDLPELRIGDVRVDLRGGDVFVAQKLLNGPQICASRKKICRETMA